MNVMVIGSGGREHTIAWKVAESEKVENVICVPGNGGTANEKKCKNVSGDDFVEIAKRENCSLVIIGPEDPLAEGVADEFEKANIACIGPKKMAARLEASKDFSKEFMKKYGVACAESKTFTDKDAAISYIKQHGVPIVVKADGLAAGKGVVVAFSENEAINAVQDLMESGRVGDAGKTLVIEDYLEGVEISVLSAVSVSKNNLENAVIVPFLPSRDHKRLLDGAKGPNTGGMGAVCPLSDVDDETMEKFKNDCLEPTLQGMKSEGFDYNGFIFFGVMLTKDGPKLLEYNVRLGDPETQAVLPLMDFDFVEMCEAIINGNLKDFDFKWKSGFQVAPVMVSDGYPGKYEKDKVIKIDETAIKNANSKVFVAGAKLENGKLLTNGGRVLACSTHGKTFDEAYKNAYKAMSVVHFDGAFYRKDIGLKGAAESVRV